MCSPLRLDLCDLTSALNALIIWKVKANSSALITRCPISSFYTLCSQVAHQRYRWVIYAQKCYQKSSTVASSYYLLSHLSRWNKPNALMICHHISCYDRKQDAVMKMQYIVIFFFCVVALLFFCLDFSLLTRCYIVLTHQTFLMPWVDYWPSSCLDLTYIIIFSQNVSPTRRTHSNAAQVRPLAKQASGSTDKTVRALACAYARRNTIGIQKFKGKGKKKRLDLRAHTALLLES